jgi:putative tryptophan/tyrosine transport system substrate-binding protein
VVARGARAAGRPRAAFRRAHGGDENDPAWGTRLSAFTQALADLGWTDGRNVRIDVRWAGGRNNQIGALAREVVGPQPDIVVTGGNPASIAVQRETRTIPIVFVNVGDPVASWKAGLGRAVVGLFSHHGGGQ